MEEKIINKLEGIKGDISFYYKNLITEETIKYNEKHEMLAASIIKLPILVECFNQINKRNHYGQNSKIVSKQSL